MAIVHVLLVAEFRPLLAVIHFIWRRGPQMATLSGKVDASEENTETGKHYTERLGHKFDPNGIGDESEDDKAKPRPIVLSARGRKVFSSGQT